MDLPRFPFDLQELKIHIRLGRPSSEAVITQPKDTNYSLCLSQIIERNFELAEWTLHKPDLVKSFSRRREDPLGRCFSLYCINARVIRRPEYYIVNIIFPVVLITSLSLAAFSLKDDAVADKFSVSFTVLLTLVAFKFAVGAALPVIPYMTYLDTYVLGSLIFSSLVVVQNALSGLFLTKADFNRDFCQFSFKGLLTLWALFNFERIVRAFHNRRHVAAVISAGDANWLDEDIKFAELQLEEIRTMEHKKQSLLLKLAAVDIVLDEVPALEEALCELATAEEKKAATGGSAEEQEWAAYLGDSVDRMMTRTPKQSADMSKGGRREVQAFAAGQRTSSLWEAAV
jgi:hypothetical protein